MAADRLIVAIFIPHEGCPYRCVFCNQNAITGTRKQADRERVENSLKTYLQELTPAQIQRPREAAFYGGSFSGLPVARQEYLLSLVQPWIENGKLDGIRISTHPLFIDPEKLALLQRYRVRTIELGIQSTDPGVLEQSGRMCSLEHIQRAVDLIREFRISLGLQLMPGLPGDDEETFQNSVDEVIALRPEFIRLYPTLVLKHTPLYKKYMAGRFMPWSLERTVRALKLAVVKLRKAGISVARMGLPSDPSLLTNYVDGPYHPALGYLVNSRVCLDQMVEKLKGLSAVPSSVVFKVPTRFVSNYTGHRKENILKLKEIFGLKDVKFQMENHPGYLELVV